MLIESSADETEDDDDDDAIALPRSPVGAGVLGNGAKIKL